MSNKEFYKMSLHVEEAGLSVYCHTFYSIHETECFNFCVDSQGRTLLQVMKSLDGESDLKKAKRLGYKIHRISKKGSRIAFDSKDKAYEHFKFIKQKHLQHLKNDLALVEKAIEAMDGTEWKDLKKCQGYESQSILPNTEEFVQSRYNFW